MDDLRYVFHLCSQINAMSVFHNIYKLVFNRKTRLIMKAFPLNVVKYYSTFVENIYLVIIEDHGSFLKLHFHINKYFYSWQLPKLIVYLPGPTYYSVIRYYYIAFPSTALELL